MSNLHVMSAANRSSTTSGGLKDLGRFVAKRQAPSAKQCQAKQHQLKGNQIDGVLKAAQLATQLRQFVSFGFIIFLTLDAQENMTEVKLFDAFCNKNTP